MRCPFVTRRQVGKALTRLTNDWGGVKKISKNFEMVVDSNIVSEIKVIVSSEKYIHGGKRKC